MQRLLILLLLFSANSVLGHALDPSLLSIKQQSKQDQYSITWKTPVKSSNTDILLPILPKSCPPKTEKIFNTSGTSRLITWEIQCLESIQGKEISIKNLESAPNNVVVKIIFDNQQIVNDILNSNKTSLIIPKKSSTWAVFTNYFWMGIYHLITGWDHLLLVIGLLLLASSMKKLLLTISSFTVGHSITLSLSSLHYISFPSLPAEILIALSIVFIGAAIVNKAHHLANWHNLGWLMALLIGLVHGLGFAGALLELGLPNQAIPLSLFSFNLGIEAGQIIIILLLMIPAIIYPKIKSKLLPKLSWAGYFIGIMASFWFWQRLLSIFS